MTFQRKWQDNDVSNSTGPLKGFAISIGSTTQKVTIAEGYALFVDSYTNSLKPQTAFKHFPAVVDLAVPTVTTQPFTFFSLDEDGTITQSALPLNNDGKNCDLFRTSFAIGIALHPDQVDITGTVSYTTIDILGTWQADLGIALQFLNIRGGFQIRPSVGTPTNQLKTNEGAAFGFGINSQDQDEPNVLQRSALNPRAIVYAFRDGIGGWIFYSSNVVRPDRWDDGTGASGDGLPNGTVTANQHTVHRFVYSPLDNILYCIFTQKSPYGTQSAAQSGWEWESFVPHPLTPFTIVPTLGIFVSPASPPIDLNDTNQALFRKMGRYDGSAIKD